MYSTDVLTNLFKIDFFRPFCLCHVWLEAAVSVDMEELYCPRL